MGQSGTTEPPTLTYCSVNNIDWSSYGPNRPTVTIYTYLATWLNLEYLWIYHKPSQRSFEQAPLLQDWDKGQRENEGASSYSSYQTEFPFLCPFCKLKLDSTGPTLPHHRVWFSADVKQSEEGSFFRNVREGPCLGQPLCLHSFTSVSLSSTVPGCSIPPPYSFVCLSKGDCFTSPPWTFTDLFFFPFLLLHSLPFCGIPPSALYE